MLTEWFVLASASWFSTLHGETIDFSGAVGLALANEMFMSQLSCLRNHTASVCERQKPAVHPPCKGSMREDTSSLFSAP